MRKKILNYRRQVDDMLAHPPEGIDYELEQRKHLVQIQFFMHERLVHEIVMALFAMAAIVVFLATVIYQELIFAVLLIVLLILLIPYILHYYVLENSVQYMYEQYDEMERRRTKNQKV
jgi:type IV secretory pathway TrbL component